MKNRCYGLFAAMAGILFLTSGAWCPALAQQGSVVVYADCNYGGAKKELEVTKYGDRDFGEVGNDEISSIRVPRGYRVTLYKDNRQRGESTIVYRDVRCLDPNWNDEVSSLEVEWVGYADDVVTVFGECDYRGKSHELDAGEYGDRDLGIGNDAISSIRIPRGFEVVVYLDNRQSGRSTVLRSSQRCLNSPWNNGISSMVVRRTNRR